MDLSRDCTGVLGLVVGCRLSFRLLARSTWVLLQIKEPARFMPLCTIPHESSFNSRSIVQSRQLYLQWTCIEAVRLLTENTY